MNRAFTLIEILVVIAIIAILAVVATVGFANTRINKTIDITTKNILFSLEEAKSNSLSGKGGTSHGIYFSSSSYTVFSGTSYVENNPDNKITTIDSAIEITTTIPNGYVIFSRLNGNVTNTGTITVREKADTSNSKTISIGSLGDINMVQ